jgi:hypothetical protein
MGQRERDAGGQCLGLRLRLKSTSGSKRLGLLGVRVDRRVVGMLSLFACCERLATRLAGKSAASLLCPLNLP